MNGTSLLMMGILLLGIMPTLGFFSPGGAFILLVLFLLILLISFKGIKIPLSKETVIPAVLLTLMYAAYYYGGFYQPSNLKAMGQLVFFAMISLLVWRIYVRKQSAGPWFFILFYLILGGWTLLTSPHPHVDTVVVFKEAPLKLLQGINPYSATFSPVYANIITNYYNHLPITFLLYLPFAVLPIDERIAILLMTVGSFLLLYHRVPEKLRGTAVLPLSLVLFMPGSFYILEHMYSETMIFFFFSLFVYFSASSEKLRFLFLGFYTTVKQNILLTIPYYLSKQSFRNKKWLYFLIPITLVAVFFLWNPRDFLDDTLFDLLPGRTPSPVNIAMTFPNLLRYFLPSSIPLDLIRYSGLAVFAATYIFLLVKSKHLLPSFLSAITLFVSYFFSHYAYFNSYYLVLLLFLFSFVYEAFFPRQKT